MPKRRRGATTAEERDRNAKFYDFMREITPSLIGVLVERVGGEVTITMPELQDSLKNGDVLAKFDAGDDSLPSRLTLTYRQKDQQEDGDEESSSQEPE